MMEGEEEEEEEEDLTMFCPLFILDTPVGQVGLVPLQRELQVSTSISSATFRPSM